MKGYKTKILGKTYSLQSDFDEKEFRKIKKEVEDKIKHYENQYPTADKLDLLVIFVFELFEKIHTTEKKLQEEKKKCEKAKKRIEQIEKRLKEKVVNLTKKL